MSELFDTARSCITYNIGYIFKEGELEKVTSVEIFDESKNKTLKQGGSKENDTNTERSMGTALRI